MRLTIVFKDEFEEHMKKQFGSFTNPQVYGVKSVHMEGVRIYTPRFQTRSGGVWMTFPDFTVRRRRKHWRR